MLEKESGGKGEKIMPPVSHPFKKGGLVILL